MSDYIDYIDYMLLITFGGLEFEKSGKIGFRPGLHKSK